MLFSKLILFLALQYFSFAKIIQNALGDSPKFYNYIPVIRENGTVLLTIEKSDRNIDDFPLLKDGENETLETLRLIGESEFTNLKTTQWVGNSLDYCEAFRAFYDWGNYQLFGYSAYIYRKKEIDIAPSVAYIVETMPQKWYLDTGVVGGQPTEREIENGIKCDAFYEAILYSFQLKGLVSTECIPNQMIYFEQSEAPETCVDTSPIEKHLPGFKIGIIQDGTIEYLKKCLTRFGPVHAEINYYKDGQTLGQGISGTFVGWEQDDNGKEYWLVATKVYAGPSSTLDGVMEYSRFPVIREEGEQSLIYGRAVFFDPPEDDDPIPGDKDDDIPKGDDPDSVSVVRAAWSAVVAVMVLPLLAILL